MPLKKKKKYPEGKRPLSLNVDRRITLEWILKNSVQRVWAGFMWVKIGPGSRLLLLG
jgi:hypothetical protein